MGKRKKKDRKKENENTSEPKNELKQDEDDKRRKEEADMKLDYLKNLEGVVGYILREAKSATIDLKDPTKIMEYALLSFSALEAGEKLSSIFDLGEPKTVVVEGKDLKFLNLYKNGKKISVFMEKNVDHNQICKQLN